MNQVLWQMHRAGDCLGPAILVHLAAGQTIEDARTSVQLDRWEPLWDEGRPFPGSERADTVQTLLVPVRPRLKAFVQGGLAPDGRRTGCFAVWYGLDTKAGRQDAESRLKQWSFLWDYRTAVVFGNHADGSGAGWVVPLRRKDEVACAV